MKKVKVSVVKGSHPNISLEVRRCEPSLWRTLNFYKYHYLTEKLNPSCKCFLFTWDETPVGFVALLNTPRLGVPYGMSISRLVVLPQYQGLGLSTRICNWCGGAVKALSDDTHDYRLYIKTAHDKVGSALSRSEKWRGTQFDGKERTLSSTLSEKGRYNNRLMRRSYCKEYIGEALYGYEDMFKPIKEMRECKKKKNEEGWLF